MLNFNILKSIKKFLRIFLIFSQVLQIRSDPSSLYLKLRYETLKEIVNTESTYVKGLEILRNNYIGPIKDSGLLSVNDIKQIFLNIDEIYEFNSKFLNEIQQKVSNFDGTLVLSDVFIKNVKLYFFLIFSFLTRRQI